MKQIFKLFCMAIAFGTFATSCGDTKKEESKVIGKNTVTVENGRLTPEILWAFGRIGSVEVSPDQSKIVYSVSYFSVEENKSNSELIVMNTDGTEKRQITQSSFRESSAKWMNDSKHIACNH